MKELIWAEHQKLRRSKIVLVAIFAVIMVAIIVFTQGQFSFGEKRYIDDAGWFMNAAQSLATFFVLPAVIALLGSYMICREEQEDTIKSLRLIPISEAKMTIAKLLITFAFSVLFYLLLFGITFLVEVIISECFHYVNAFFDACSDRFCPQKMGLDRIDLMCYDERRLEESNFYF